jgi:hypothetical protein
MDILKAPVIGKYENARLRSEHKNCVEEQCDANTL